MDLHSYTCFHTSSRQGLNHAEEGTSSSGGEHPPGELFRNGPSPRRDEPPGTSPSSAVFSLISSTRLVKLTPGSKMLYGETPSSKTLQYFSRIFFPVSADYPDNVSKQKLSSL